MPLKSTFKKLSSTLWTILKFYDQLCRGPVYRGELNPLYITIATTGYYIQSHTLRIPDRFGIFSPPPPDPRTYQRRRVHEALSFVFIVFWIGYSLFLFAYEYVLWKLYGRPEDGEEKMAVLVISIVTMMVSVIGFWWVWIVGKRYRRLGYDEREEWKVRLV